MKAAILNSAMLDSTILHKKFHLFILTQLDDGSHLQLAILDSAILVFPLKLTHTSQDCFPPFPKKKLPSIFPLHHLHKILHSFNLMNLMMAAILNSAILDSAILHKKTSFIHSDSTWCGSHLELCHVGFRHCHLGLRHLLYLFTDSFKNTLTPIWLSLKLIQSDSNSFILT